MSLGNQLSAEFVRISHQGLIVVLIFKLQIPQVAQYARYALFTICDMISCKQSLHLHVAMPIIGNVFQVLLMWELGSRKFATPMQICNHRLISKHVCRLLINLTVITWSNFRCIVLCDIRWPWKKITMNTWMTKLKVVSYIQLKYQRHFYWSPIYHGSGVCSIDFLKAFTK